MPEKNFDAQYPNFSNDKALGSHAFHAPPAALPLTLVRARSHSVMPSIQSNTNRWVALRQNGASLIDQVLFSSASFITTWIIGRFGSDSELGLFLLGTSAVMTILCVLESLVCMPYIFLVHRQKPDQLPLYTGSSLLHVMVVALIASSVLTLGAFAGGQSLTVGLPTILYLISGILPFHLLRFFLRRFHLSSFNMRSLLAYDTLAFGIQVSILFLAWQQEKVSGLVGFLTIGAAGLIVSILWLWHNPAQYKFSSQAKKHFVENLIFGKSVLGAQLLWVVHIQALLWLITYCYSKELAGQYGACAAVVMLVNPFVLGMLNVISPRVASSFATDGNRAVRLVVWRNLCFMVVVVTITLGALLLFGDTVVQFLFGDTYAGHQSVITYLAIAMIAETACKAPEHGLQAIHRPGLVAWINAVRLLATLLMAALLVPTAGLVGAAMSLAAADWLAALLFCSVFHYQTMKVQAAPLDLRKSAPLPKKSGTEMS